MRLIAQGSHKAGKLLEHGYPDWGDGKVNKAYHGIKSFHPSWTKQLVYLEMDAGDTVIFHPLLIHGSGACLLVRSCWWAWKTRSRQTSPLT